MADATVTIPVHGVLDHARAETLAARIRAAVRNGKRSITVALDPGTVIASPAFLAFVLRAGAVLRRDGGELKLGGDPAALEALEALTITTVLGAPAPADRTADPGQGAGT